MRTWFGVWVSALVVSATASGCGRPNSNATSFGTNDTSAGDTSSSDTEETGDGGETGTDTGDTGGIDDMGGEMSCECAPGTDRIFLLSDDEELWAYDPLVAGEAAFELITEIPCSGGDYPYSMAVDRNGMAWIMYGGTNEIRTVSVHEPEAGCSDPGYEPGQAGFGVFGLSFVSEGPGFLCEDIYAMAFSEEGGFAEGPGIGRLGVMDPEELVLTEVGPLDYDGGELAGTAEGRLFGFAGVEPAKLIEFDKETGEVLEIEPLDEVDKTNASAFAFHSGDAFIFTEAGAVDCQGCLEASCPNDIENCLLDPECTEQFECAVQQADITDECGGLMPESMIQCMSGVCVDECFPANLNIVSRVTRVDWDESDGNGRAIEVVESAAPIRVVGAANSICAPYNPP